MDNSSNNEITHTNVILN